MALRDFAPRRRTITVGGRRIVVRPPTVETVRLFLELFAIEIGAVVVSIRKNGAPEIDAAVDSMLPLFLTDWRILAVLETCSDLTPELAEILPPSAVKQLAETLLSLCDVERVIRSLNIATDDSPAATSSGPDPHDQAFVTLGEKFGVAPHTICEWPYEAFLTTCDTLAAMAEEAARGAQQEAQRPFLDERVGPLMGINVYKADAP